MLEKLLRITGIDKPERKNVALVLSSGGARGLAHIGAIEMLEEEGYHITSIAGCSMGALIGGVYAAGKLEEFREWMKGIDRKKMLELTDFSLSLNHIVKGDRIIEAIMEFVPDVAIENLPIPYCAVATDWMSGREVVFRTGSLFEAIRASISLPSFYKPVHRDGMILIDGGVINPIPLNRVVRHKDDLLMGVDVSGYDYKAKENMKHEISERRNRGKSMAAQILDKLIPDNIDFNHYTVLSRTSSLMIRQNAKLMAQLMKPDMLVDIQISRYGSFDYDKSEKLIAIGRQKTLKAINNFTLQSQRRKKMTSKQSYNDQIEDER
ncbi:MAG: patatin-like phospholipase family protein [Prevotella sp.]|nr:patatin-like phospholipase family protein [Prevotella sp.]